MSARLLTFFEAQARLTTWTDELEYLGYILCELIDEEGLNTTGYRCHQAADLPAIIDILRRQLQEPGGYLAQIMSEDELKVFRRLLRKSKEIRNLMAHYNIRDGERLNDLENTKENLSDMLEFAIRGAALDRGVYQVAWSPYHHICKVPMEAKRPSIVMISLNKEPMLSFRDRVLCDYDLQQRQAIRRRSKRKATEDGRQKQKDDYETALIRKQQRKERDIDMRSKHQSKKLDKIEKRFIKSQKRGNARLSEVKVRMEEEQRLFHQQRAEILKDGIYPPTDENLLLITVFLSITSPLWLTAVFLYSLYSRAWGLCHRA